MPASFFITAGLVPDDNAVGDPLPNSFYITGGIIPDDLVVPPVPPTPSGNPLGANNPHTRQMWHRMMAVHAGV